MNEPCPFCSLSKERIIASNDLAVAVRDAYPVSPGHALVIPKRHVADWFDATREEQGAIMDLLAVCRTNLLLRPAMDCGGGCDAGEGITLPVGFNIGINCGQAAGQTVPHSHVHLIPRYEGDQDDPRGGVRLIFPGKARYWDE